MISVRRMPAQAAARSWPRRRGPAREGAAPGITCTFDGGRTWKDADLSGGEENYFDGGVDVVKFFGLRGWATGWMTSDRPLNLVWRTDNGGKSWASFPVG